MAQKEVLELDQLMRLTGVGVYSASVQAGIAPSNWSRWRNHDVSPNMSKFSRFRVAVIDLGVERGALPQGAHDKTVLELIEVAKGWRV